MYSEEGDGLGPSMGNNVQGGIGTLVMSLGMSVRGRYAPHGSNHLGVTLSFILVAHPGPVWDTAGTNSDPATPRYMHVQKLQKTYFLVNSCNSSAN